jgi:hypothetical protein
MPTTIERIERTRPRMSLNALASYLTGTPTRRRSILAQQKRPAPVGMAYYQLAQEAIARFLVSPERDELQLVETLRQWHAAPINSEHDRHRWQSNIEAVESFAEFHRQLRWPGFSATRGGNRQPKLEFGGLELSVRPDVLLRRTSPRFGELIGAVRLYFGKHEPLSEQAARYSSAVLLEFLRQHHADLQPSPKHTLMVDVFGQKVFQAPASSHRLLSDVKNACMEIARMWEIV